VEEILNIPLFTEFYTSRVSDAPEQWKKHLNWLFLGFVGDKILANSFFGIIIIINQYKDPEKNNNYTGK